MIELSLSTPEPAEKPVFSAGLPCTKSLLPSLNKKLAVIPLLI